MDWQQAVVLALVAWALWYLTRRTLRKQADGCGGCAGACEKPAVSSGTNREPELIQLETAPRKR
jgi:hypothetical protein